MPIPTAKSRSDPRAGMAPARPGATRRLACGNLHARGSSMLGISDVRGPLSALLCLGLVGCTSAKPDKGPLGTPQGCGGTGGAENLACQDGSTDVNPPDVSADGDSQAESGSIMPDVSEPQNPDADAAIETSADAREAGPDAGDA